MVDVVEVVNIPEGGHPVIDALRVVVAGGALWLAVLVVRLSWLQHHRGHRRPHWLVFASYALALLMISGMRVTHWGEAPTFDLWLSLAVVIAGVAGVLMRNSLGIRAKFGGKDTRHGGQ